MAGGIGGVLNNPSMQNMQNLQNSVGQQPGQVPQQPGQPQQPGLVQAGQGGFNPGTPFQRPLPPGYQSPYANYGFDSGFQSYLDNQYLGSMTDAGVNYQYDPTNQTFTGGTMTGRYNPIPLNVMQQAAGGDRSVLAPYFQSRFPQQPPMPDMKNMISELPLYSTNGEPSITHLPPPQQPNRPGQQMPFNRFNRPGQQMPFPRFGGNAVRGNPNQGGYNPQQPRPIGFEGPIGNWERLNSNMMNQPTGTSADVAAQRGPNPQRGLGGLQIDKFKSRLGQR
jgi:hypothetical protein